jgi:hypothetical protein
MWTGLIDHGEQLGFEFIVFILLTLRNAILFLSLLETPSFPCCLLPPAADGSEEDHTGSH